MNLTGIRVSTDVAAAFIVRDGVTAEDARKWIYNASGRGEITNYGKSGKGKASWDLGEIQAALWPKSH